MVVYKYPINEFSDYIGMEMPQGAKILTVQMQYDVPCIWALVDPDMPLEQRVFRLAGTGHPIYESLINLDYIGTFQMSRGDLIFHLLEIFSG